MKLKPKRRFSIKLKLFLSYLLIVSTTTAASSLIIYSYSSKSLKHEALRIFDQVLASAYENLISLAEDVENSLLLVQANRDIQLTLEHYKDTPGSRDEVGILSNAVKSIDPFRTKISDIELYIFNKSNYPSVFDGNNIYSDEMVKNDPWFMHTIQANGVTQWSVFNNNLADNNYITASKLIFNTTDNMPAAVVRAKVDIGYFTKKTNNLRISKTGRVFLTTQTQVINDRGSAFLDLLTNQKTYFGNMVKEAKANSILKIKGDEYMVSCRRIKNTGLYVTAMQPLRELNANAALTLQVIFVTFLLNLLVAFFLLFFVSNYLTEPLYSLATKMRNFSITPHTPLEIRHNDEIGDLYKSFNTMTSTIDNLIQDINTLYERQKNADLKVLQAQINPHFLYNTLNSISCMAQKHGTEDIRKVVSALSDFFKHSLNKGEEFTTIEGELKQVQSYIDIQKIRFKDRFCYHAEADNNLLSFRVIKLLIQPLVENCIVHAFEGIDYIGEISVRVFREAEYLYITVSDNGLGANVNDLNRYTAKTHFENDPIEKYGIHNVNERLRLYFGTNSGLSYDENEWGGLTATIKIEVKA